jgi:isoaspartyl peptidase/L-asparaginase-like protein (Ntn-hydrolase superfamily)
MKILNIVQNVEKNCKERFNDLDLENKELFPYEGHDTVGVVSLDKSNNMSVGTSTSGLFIKRQGRIVD